MRRTLLAIPCLLPVILGPAVAGAQVSKQTLDSISTPTRVETRIGTLEFKDGAPSPATVDKVRDTVDFVHGVDVFLDAFQGASTYALRQGFLGAGVADNSVLIFTGLMDSKSLFLTANADTIYFLSFVDMTRGPVVVETPPNVLGTFDDMWFRWVIDFGAPGPDRGEGGKYLLLPPGYAGPLPDSGFHVAAVRTSRAVLLGRSFLIDGAPTAAVESIKRALKIYPYTPGGFGTSIATLLNGEVRPGRPAPPQPVKFMEGTGKAFNTVPPSDFSFYEMLNALVQQEPVDALDPEVMGQLRAIGIIKGKPFQPDARMKKTLTDAAAVANAQGRALNFRAPEAWAYYPGSAWSNMLWTGGYSFETPPPLVTREGIQPLPTLGAVDLDSRAAFFYGYTGITPAMIMRLPDVGSQYLMAFLDGEKNYFDGGRTYRVTLPPKIPQAKFWSLTLYDNQTRSMLETPQRFPRAGSQSYPTPAAVANADGSTTIYFGPTLPDGVKPGNWIQTAPGKGWFVILRLYSPLESFFTKAWRPGEILPVK